MGKMSNRKSIMLAGASGQKMFTSMTLCVLFNFKKSVFKFSQKF